MRQVVSNTQAERMMSERNKIIKKKGAAVREMDILLLVLDGIADLVIVAKNSAHLGLREKENSTVKAICVVVNHCMLKG